MNNIFNLPFENLENYFESINEKKYRATQLYDYLYKKRTYNLDSMTNISKELRDKISKEFDFSFIEIIKKQVDIDVKKYLFKRRHNQWLNRYS